METVTYESARRIPVIAETEVLVVGGGPGGIAAAVMAARQGADVLLAEKNNAPGGMAYAGEISPFMVNHLGGKTLDAPVFVEWNREMWQLRGLPPEKFNENIDFEAPIDKAIAMLAAEKLLDDAGVKTLYHLTFFDTVQHDGAIDTVIFHSKASGLCAIKAKAVVDATGDGDVATAAGCPFVLGDGSGRCQPMTLCFKLGGIDRSRLPSHEEINRLYETAQSAGEVRCPRENLLWFDTFSPEVIHLNTTRVIVHDPTDAGDLSRAEKEARRQMLEIVGFMRRRVPGCENAEIRSVAAQTGVRESRHILGELFQTAEDFRLARKYPDGIARVRYCIDIHNPSGRGTTIVDMPEGEWYELSFRALIPRNCGNLLMGCRAVSADHVLHSSMRIMPVVCSIGQAAGMGAAMMVRRGCRAKELSGVEVRRRLIENGARLV